MGCAAIATINRISVIRKIVKKIIAVGSLLAIWCPANICIAQRMKPLIAIIIWKEFNELKPICKINSLKQVIRYFVNFADKNVGRRPDGLNNCLYTDREASSSFGNNGSSTGW